MPRGCNSLGREVYDNGPIVTHAGMGYGGADVSMASVNPNIGGAKMVLQTGQQHYRVADDFIVPAGGWMLDGITLNGYGPDAPPGSPGWTGFSLKIWQGSAPGEGSPLYETIASPAISSSNVYRVLNGAGNLQDNARAVDRILYALPNVTLVEGQYWFDFQVSGGVSAAMNCVMDISPQYPDNPITARATPIC